MNGNDYGQQYMQDAYGMGWGALNPGMDWRGGMSNIDQAMMGSPASFALQGMDPETYTGMRRRGRQMGLALTSGGAQRLTDFEAMAPGLINMATQGAYGGALESMAGQQRLAQQQQMDAMAAAGMAPSQLFGRMAGEQALGWAQPMAMLGQQAQAGQAQGLMDLYGNVLNARNQMEQFYDQLMLMNALASKSRALARRGQEYGVMGDLFGMAGSGATAATGGGMYGG